MVHNYVFPASGHNPADTASAMKVTFGFPLNTWALAKSAAEKVANDGRAALATGLKFHIAAAAVPLEKYYATFVLRMIPFYKATGGNQIEVVVNSERAVKCWAWGSENGQGWCRKMEATTGVAMLAPTEYMGLTSLASSNIVICELGTAAGTATTGDVIIVPTT